MAEYAAVEIHISAGDASLPDRLYALLDDFEAHERIDHEVAERQESRQQHRHPDRPRVDDDRAEVGENAGVRNHVPAVPTQDAAEVDAEAGEPEHRNRCRPGHTRPQVLVQDRLDEVEREKAEQHPGPRRRRDYDDIDPERHDRAREEMLEVGEDVRRVR